MAFKAFFKRNKKLLISLLQSFLPFPEGVKILDAELVDAHHPPEALEDHKDMALRMLEQNMNMSLIVKLTGLPIEKLQQLKKS